MSAKQSFVRVVSCHEHERIESVDDLDAHAASRSLDHARSSFEVCRIEILHLRLCDLLRFRARHLGDFRLVRLAGSLFNAGGFLFIIKNQLLNLSISMVFSVGS